MGIASSSWSRVPDWAPPPLDDGRLQPLEPAHLPCKDGSTSTTTQGRGLKQPGRRKWKVHVHAVAQSLRNAPVAHYVVMGGGSVAKSPCIPPHARRGDHANVVSRRIPPLGFRAATALGAPEPLANRP